LRAERDLMGVQIMEPKLVEERLLDDLMGREKAVGEDAASVENEGFRHVPVDIDRAPVPAVASEIGDVVSAVDLADARFERCDQVEESVVGDVRGPVLPLGFEPGAGTWLERLHFIKASSILSA